jgi:hypothetical protein
MADDAAAALMAEAAPAAAAQLGAVPEAIEQPAEAEPNTDARNGLKAVPRNDEPTMANRPSGDQSLAGPRVALAEELLRGISVGLRAFPEVEWACVLSDGSDIPLIALRVDPSFLNRVADITDAIMDVAEKYAAVVQVMLLNNTELVKNARRHGKAFYPWRR